jgi:hypothetical protein
MRVDVNGNLWCAWSGGEAEDGVVVFAPDGKMIGRIMLPERCANLRFGGTKRNRLFMAASQSVYSLYVETQGSAWRLTFSRLPPLNSRIDIPHELPLVLYRASAWAVTYYPRVRSVNRQRRSAQNPAGRRRGRVRKFAGQGGRAEQRIQSFREVGPRCLAE